VLIKTRRDPISPSQITDRSVWQQRRRFLKAAALVGVGAGLGRYAGSAVALEQGPGKHPAIAGIEPTPFGKGLEPTAYEHVTGYNNFYEFGTGKGDPAEYSGSLRTRPWTVVVDGECEAPGSIGIEEVLAKFTQEERI